MPSRAASTRWSPSRKSTTSASAPWAVSVRRTTWNVQRTGLFTSSRTRPRWTPRRGERADVFRAFGQAYRARHALSSEQAKVFDAILACRTVTLGGHLDVCTECGFEQPACDSCRDRHCSECQSLAAVRWVEARKKCMTSIERVRTTMEFISRIRSRSLDVGIRPNDHQRARAYRSMR